MTILIVIKGRPEMWHTGWDANADPLPPTDVSGLSDASGKTSGKAGCEASADPKPSPGSEPDVSTTLAATRAGIFRIHDPESQPEAGAGQEAAPILRQLSLDWSRLCALTSMRYTLRRWSAANPCFEGITSLGDLVDRIDAGDEQEADRLLLGLVRLAQAGHQLAARVVLQAMLPKLARMSRTTRPSSNDNRRRNDRAHITVATFWEVIYAYPVSRRHTRVAANLALDTLHRLTTDLRRPPADIPMDPEETAGRLASTPEASSHHPTGSPSPDADLLEVIAWALDVEAITPEEATVLVRVYLPSARDSSRAVIAERMGISQSALRQRTSRARRRLIAAVRAAADPVALATTAEQREAHSVGYR